MDILALGCRKTVIAFLVAIAVTASLLGTATGAEAAEADWSAFEQIGDLGFSEASGAVASRQHAGIVWVMRDSGYGDRTMLYALRIDNRGRLNTFGDGSFVRAIDIQGVSNGDWEDIAVDDEGNIWIGELGNNTCTRPNRGLYRIAEPNPYSANKVTEADFYPIVFPEIPGSCTAYNVESLFIVDGTPYIITKTLQNMVFEVNSLHRDRNNTLSYIGDLRTPENTSRFERLTGASISDDGTRLVVTARGMGAVVYESLAGNTGRRLVEDLISDSPTKVSGRGQNEGVEILPGSHHIVLVSEEGPIQIARGPGAPVVEDPTTQDSDTEPASNDGTTLPDPDPSGCVTTTVADVSLLQHSADGSQSDRRWQVIPIDVPGPGTISATLAWSTSADLNLFLRDPSGQGIAWSNRSDNPEVILHDVEEAGTYSLAVLFRSGSATYELDASFAPDPSC